MYNEYDFNNDGVTCRECGGEFEEIDSEDEDIDVDREYDDEHDSEDIKIPMMPPVIVKEGIVMENVSNNKFDTEEKTRFD